MRSLTTAMAGTLAMLIAGSAAADTLVSGTLGTQTWTPAGNPYRLQGQARVAAGARLTIAAGVAVVAEPDAALIVEGALDVNGTETQPVTMTGPATPGSWTGVIGSAGAAASLRVDHAIIDYADTAVHFTGSGLHRTTGLTARYARVAGIFVSRSVTIDRYTSIGSQYGVYAAGGSTRVTNCVIRGEGTAGYAGVRLIRNAPSSALWELDLVNCTLDDLRFGAVVEVDVGQNARLGVANTIVSRMRDRGVVLHNAGTATVTVVGSDVWGSALSDYENVVPGAGTISVDPQYAGVGDLHLGPGSACRDAATAALAPDHDHDGRPRPLDGDGIGAVIADIGAYEAGPDPVCGNGGLEGAEQCDDGNVVSGDGCSATCFDETAIDAGVIDAPTDAALPDAAQPDAALPDAALPDAALPDAALPDAALPDAALPDAALPDAARPDAAGTTPDAAGGGGDSPDGGCCSTGGGGPGGLVLGAAVLGLLRRRRGQR